MAQETDDSEFNDNEFDVDEFDDDGSDHGALSGSEDSECPQISEGENKKLVRSITNILAGSQKELCLEYYTQSFDEVRTVPSPSTILWACIQLRTHADTIQMTYLKVDAMLLETDEAVENLVEFICNSPTLSEVYLNDFWGRITKTDILVLATAANQSIKKVSLGDLHSGMLEAVIAVLKAGHVETLHLLQPVVSGSFGFTEGQCETLADALLMSPGLSYVYFYQCQFAISVLEKLSHGEETKMKSLTVSVEVWNRNRIYGNNDDCYQMIVDSLLNCVTSPRANVRTLKLSNEHTHSRLERIGVQGVEFRIEPDNMDSKTILHLECDIHQNLVPLLGVDTSDDNWLGTVTSMPELEHLKLHSYYNLRDTDIDSLSGALSLRSICFSFFEVPIFDPSSLCSTIDNLVAMGSLKRASIEGLHIDYQGWASLSELIISSAPSLKEVNLDVAIFPREGALQDGNADGFPATTEKMPQALKNPSWNMPKSLLAEFLWSVHSLEPHWFKCNVVFSDEGSVHSIACNARFDQPAWECFCKMLADSSCMIERVDLSCGLHASSLDACTGDPLWAALNSNSSLKYCNLNNQKKDDWNDMITYYTTRNKLGDLFSGNEIITMKLWVPAVEAVRNQYHGKSLILHLVQANPLLFVRERGKKRKHDLSCKLPI